jgi:hypothetical protein
MKKNWTTLMVHYPSRTNCVRYYPNTRTTCCSMYLAWYIQVFPEELIVLRWKLPNVKVFEFRYSLLGGM